MLLNHSRTDAQALVKEPALIRLAESGQVTGKVLRLRLMVTVVVSGCVLKLGVVVADKAICFRFAGRGLHHGAMELT